MAIPVQCTVPPTLLLGDHGLMVVHLRTGSTLAETLQSGGLRSTGHRSRGGGGSHEQR